MAFTTGDNSAAGAPPPSGTIDEVAYRLEEWEEDDLAAVEQVLQREGVEYRWEDGVTLVVGPDDEDKVDGLLDEVEAARMDAEDPGAQVGTRWCPTCGAEYLPEVEVCPDDGSTLVDERPAGLADAEDHDELIYELVDWSEDRRNELTLLLEGDGIAYEWEGADLVVADAVEAQVDAFIDRVEQGQALAEAPADVDDEAGYNMLSDLFVAADRLSHDADDLALCGDVVDAAAPVREMAAPFGVDDGVWTRVQQLTASLVDAIEGEDDDTVVGERAAKLSALLRPFM